MENEHPMRELSPEEQIKKENAELKTRVRELEQRNKELEKEKIELIQLSYRDSLTGLYNRRFFNENLGKMVAENESPVLDERRAGTDNREVGLIVVDADQFKHINDTYGHAAGDEVLKSVSRALETLNKREATDIVARTGGDEFVVLLPGMTEEMAVERATNLWSIIREFKVRAGEDLIPITISLGVGSLKLTGVKDALYTEEIQLKGNDLPPDQIQIKLEEKKKELFSAFLDQVDEAMYAVKKEKGRDQIARVSEIKKEEKLSDEAA